MKNRIVNKSKHQLPSYSTRVCQMIIKRHEKAEWINTAKLEETTRGSGGFGHTGKK